MKQNQKKKKKRKPTQTKKKNKNEIKVDLNFRGRPKFLVGSFGEMENREHEGNFTNIENSHE